MIRVQTEFQDRVAEIEAYFSFIKNVDNQDILFIQSDRQSLAYLPGTQEDLLRTFKASAFLLLYNLMESTISNAIEAIFEELDSQRISFDSCREEIKCVILENLKQHNPKRILTSINYISNDIVVKTFKKEEVVSGNVDARKIRDIADGYGFSKPYDPLRKGDSLLTVKSHRNDLAHGSKSFADIGRNFTVPDILRIKTEVIDYLSTMLSNVDSYISQREYLSIGNQYTRSKVVHFTSLGACK